MSASTTARALWSIAVIMPLITRRASGSTP
jgi:hypothetical protein